MTSKEIREAVSHTFSPQEFALFEIAAQLAELNERAGDGGFPVQLVGAVPTDFHTFVVSAVEKDRRGRGLKR